MDRIKGLFDSLTGGDGQLDAADIQAQAGNLGLKDLTNLQIPTTADEAVETLTNGGASDLLTQATDMVPQDVIKTLSDLRNKLPF